MSNENRGLGTESIFASGRKVKGITLHESGSDCRVR